MRLARRTALVSLFFFLLLAFSTLSAAQIPSAFFGPQSKPTGGTYPIVSFGTPSIAELYNPATGAFAPTGSINAERYFHAATLLSNGEVLLEGGNWASSGVLASAELYNPATGNFTLTGSLNVGREEHGATLLPNGQVLVEGGQVANASSTATAELYNPATGAFSPTGSMSVARCCASLTLLQAGSALAAGGATSATPVTVSASAELFHKPSPVRRWPGPCT